MNQNNILVEKEDTTFPKYRNRTEIITSILKSIADKTKYDDIKRDYRGAPKTKIMYASFLSYAQLKQYLLFIIEKELICQLTIREEYGITKKGLEFMEYANKVFKTMGMDEYQTQNMCYVDK